MAYKNLVSLSLSNSAETFRHFRDFICKRNGSAAGSADYSTLGIGWTLHEQYCQAGGVGHYYDNTNEGTTTVNDYIVIYSAGEDGDRDLYFKITYTATSFTIIGYLYWNDTTHAGVHAYGSAGYWTNTAATNNILWIYGSMDHFNAISKYSTSYYLGRGGWMPDSPESTEVTVAAGAITAGSAVVVTMPAVPAEWAVGIYLFVRDTANIERVLITNISGNDVTFAAFVASYSAGSKFCLEVTNYPCVDNGNAASTFSLQISQGGTKAQSVNQILPTIYPTSADARTGLYPCLEIWVGNASTRMGPLSDIYWTQAFTSESTHTIGAVGYRFFTLYSAYNVLIKEV